MNVKWIPLTLPFIAFSMMIVDSAKGQNAPQVTTSAENQGGWLQNAFQAADDSAAGDTNQSPDDSYKSGWITAPGHMPVFYPGAFLPNSMPILKAPDVDPEMIIPMKMESDSTQTGR